MNILWEGNSSVAKAKLIIIRTPVQHSILYYKETWLFKLNPGPPNNGKSSSLWSHSLVRRSLSTQSKNPSHLERIRESTISQQQWDPCGYFEPYQSHMSPFSSKNLSKAARIIQQYHYQHQRLSKIACSQKSCINRRELSQKLQTNNNSPPKCRVSQKSDPFCWDTRNGTK